MSKALLVIDLQNDYFPEGKFPLWNADATLKNVVQTIQKAHEQNVSVIIIQHIANKNMGIAPFFNDGTDGADVHSDIILAAPQAPIIVKEFADSFISTSLEATLKELGITELLVCGMMTQNCVTHTAISKSAEKYKVSILVDCCTTVDEMIHTIALHAVSTRVALVSSSDVL
jgi:nicotinamidase-related amidase